jgi:hypothetical protein
MIDSGPEILGFRFLLPENLLCVNYEDKSISKLQMDIELKQKIIWAAVGTSR